MRINYLIVFKHLTRPVQLLLIQSRLLQTQGAVLRVANRDESVLLLPGMFKRKVFPPKI